MSLSAIQARNQAIGAANAFTKKSLDGLGALKGANLEVTNIAYNDTDNRTEVEVSWTSNSGVVESDTIYLPYGVSVVSVRVDNEGKNLIFTNSKGVDLAPVPLPENLKVKISKADGNILEEKADGLYVPTTGMKISKEEGNKLSEKADGLYASGVDISAEANNAIEKKADGLYVQETAIPTKTSQLTNDSSFVTESDLTAKNYADKTYVGEQIAQSEHLKREIVTVLPEPSVADEHTIYMLKDDSVQGNDKYKEYMLIEGVVQCVGDTSVDLTDYAKKAELPTELPANGGNADTVNNHTVESDVPVDAKFTDTVYDDTKIKEDIKNLDDNVSVIEVENLIPFPYAQPERTTNGVTFTFAEDGSVIANGTATSDADFSVSIRTNFGTDKAFMLKPGTYAITGCPEGGSDSTYRIHVQFGDNDGVKYNLRADYGKGFVFEVTEEYAQYACQIQCHVKSGYTVSNLVFKPMLVRGNILKEYQPYKLSRKSLRDDVDKQNESLSVIGKCKNLLNSTFDTYTSNGVTFTRNADETYTLSGSRTDTSNASYVSIIENLPLEIGKYKITGALNENNYIRCIIRVSDSENKNIYDYGKGVVLNVSKANTTITLLIVSTDDTSKTRIVKPMLTKNLNATFDDFVPYTGDGDTLTHDVAELKNDLAPKKIELQNVDERVTIQDNGSFIINGFAFVNLLVTFNETLQQWSNFVRLPRPKGGNVTVYCENSVKLTIYSQDNLPGDCGTFDIVQSGTEIRLLVNYEVA